MINMFMELLSATVLGGKYINEKMEQNKPYYGTSRDAFRNNPRIQRERIGNRRLNEDIQNGVSPQERARRRDLGYYDGKNVTI